MGTLTVKETVNGGRSYRTHVDTSASQFVSATVSLHEWLWLNQSQETAAVIIIRWMRGEVYSDHSVSVRYYVPGTVGHWFEILYVA